MKTRMRVFRMTGVILAGFIGLGLFPALSFATVINDCPGGVCSLQDLFNGSTISINDKRFDSWQLFNQATSLGQLPDYSLIGVNPIDDDPLNPGLSFSTNDQMSITNGLAGDFIYFDFGYRVQTMDNVPRIKDNSQQLGSYDFSGTGGSVGIAQTVCEGGFFCPLSSSELVSLTNVFADNTIPALNLFDSVVFLPHAGLFVENEVSAFNSFDGESVALNGFEQRFSQIPEPSSFTLLVIGLAGFLTLRCWQTRIHKNVRKANESSRGGDSMFYNPSTAWVWLPCATLCRTDKYDFNLDRGTIMERLHASPRNIGDIIEKQMSWIDKSQLTQTSYTSTWFAAVVLLMAGCFTPVAMATTITGPFTASTGTVSGTANTPNPGGAGNTVTLTEGIPSFSPSLSFGVSFLLPNKNEGRTRYRITKKITNNMNTAWTDFQVGVGCGSYGETPCFGNPISEPLTINYSTNPTSDGGGTLGARNAAHFDWTGLYVKPGQTVTFTFDVDTCANCSGGWAIHQNPNTVSAACVQPPNSTMVAWYPFDEGAGTTAANLATGNTGTYLAKPSDSNPTPVVGMVSEALNFNGSNYVESPSTMVTNFGPANTPDQCSIPIGGLYSSCLGDFSMDAWVKVPANASTDVLTIVDKRDNTVLQGYHFFLFQNRIGIQLASGGNVANYGSISTGPVIYDDTWHHVAVTVDRRVGSFGIIYFYLDGKRVSSTNTTVFGSLVNSSPLRVGIRTANDPLNGGFEGGIDELEIFNRVLTASEVMSIYNAQALGKCK